MTDPDPAPAELVHFYSYATGVSLELPVGFEQVAHDDGSATYAVLGDDDVTPVPGTQLLVQVVATLPDDATDTDRDEAVDGLATALADRPGTPVEQAELQVDDERVVLLTTRGDDATTVLSAAAVTPHRLVSVTAVARDGDVLAAHRAAVESIRWVGL
ncbi:hypothetical protein ABFT23_04570 [Nocardioides sp. C4-1]|uniref:hypothetical protein n=1 Tax=Nocardioides sp. C4-1 TaxID=3151851 RepID=UPI003263060F